MNLNYLTYEKGRKIAADSLASALPTATGCLEWQGPKDMKGYGRLQLHTCMGRQQLAHRIAYLLHNGPFDQELVIRHQCNNPACVNPEHLSTGTPKDNVADMLLAGTRYQPDTRGTKHPMCKLSEMDVHEIRALSPVLEMVLGKANASKTLAARLGINRQTIDSIVSGKSWGWLKSPAPAQVGGH